MTDDELKEKLSGCEGFVFAAGVDERVEGPAPIYELYKKYNKAKNAEIEISAQIKKGEAELQYVKSVLDALSRCEGQAELDEIRLELTEAGYIKAAAEEIKLRSRQYAKRQLTWFKRNEQAKRLVWDSSLDFVRVYQSSTEYLEETGIV